MPRIDDLKIQDKIFKKKAYRSWDENLLEKLNLTKNGEQQEKIETKQDVNRVYSELDKSSIEVHKESNESSIKRHKGFDNSSTKVQQESNKNSIMVHNNPNNKVHLEFVVGNEQVRKLIAKLGGNEKKLFFYIINLCAIKGSLSTDDILGEDLNKAISITRNSRETAIKRLMKKGLLKREKGKTGIHGTLNLYVNELIKSEALNYLNTRIAEQELLANWGSTRIQNNHPNKVQLESNLSLYSSSNINENNTTKSNELPENWININFEALESIGFSLTQLKQLHAKLLNSPEIIQESINHFAFGLENNPKFSNYNDPLNVLMGVLRKGQAWIETNYQSPQEIAQREFLERKHAERERLKKLEEDIYKLALDEWQETLTVEQKSEIAPVKKDSMDITPSHVKFALYFKEHVWPNKKKNYLIN